MLRRDLLKSALAAIGRLPMVSRLVGRKPMATAAPPMASDVPFALMPVRCGRRIEPGDLVYFDPVAGCASPIPMGNLYPEPIGIAAMASLSVDSGGPVTERVVVVPFGGPCA